MLGTSCALLFEPVSTDTPDDPVMSAPDLSGCIPLELECAHDPTAGDGVDNDCDGVVDEGCHCDYEGRSTGLCASGLRSGDDGTCMAPAFFVAVEQDLCDGEDNDCDGAIDEGCVCDFMGLDVGVCQDASLAPDGGCAAPAAYVALESDASCDGVDNDCDGVVDEGCPCDLDGATLGLCQDLRRDDAGACPEPVGYTSQESDCDETDNDCDGETDEGCFLNSDPGAALAPGATLQIDIGDRRTPDPGWTHITGCNDTLRMLEDLSDDQGRPTRVDLRWRFTGSNEAGPTRNEVGLPEQISSDSCWVGSFSGHDDALLEAGGITFDALDPRHTYTLETYSARQNRDQNRARLTRLTVEGASTMSQEIDAVDNTTTTLTFPELRPAADGTLKVHVAVSPDGESRFSYLNAARLSRVIRP